MFHLKKTISNNLVNLSGWTTNKKIIVIESDDWGSIRMPSLDAYNALLKEGIQVDKSPYCRLDNLCSSEDVQALFEILRKHKDSNGNSPCITANVIVANPNFEKIRDNQFQCYHYETIDKTFNHFFPNNNPMFVWKEGMKDHLFFPQFHGREHVNVPFWLELLQKNDPIYKAAFNQNCWGISNDIYKKYPKSIQASFDYNHKSELEFMKESVADGLAIFKNLFGYHSESFIPTNYTWPSELNDTLVNGGVKYMQGMKYQLLPKPFGTVKRNKIRRCNGQILGQPTILQLVRNVQFEPSLVPDLKKDQSITACLNQIKTAFFWKKPAILSVHRINFCGTLSEENRTNNLKRLDLLLYEIKKTWPEVQFVNSVTLGKMIKEKL